MIKLHSTLPAYILVHSHLSHATQANNVLLHSKLLFYMLQVFIDSRYKSGIQDNTIRDGNFHRALIFPIMRITSVL